MTVRGGKNRVLVYTGAGLLIVALVLFYHNAATRLEDARTKYEKCHLSEESLSGQLQVILEYKSRLEKSLQQEKSDHAESKEEAKNKAEEERHTREKDNLESINKFTALQQQYKLLQSQHEDVTQELDKTKQELLAAEDRNSNLEEQVSSLTTQAKLLQDGRESDNTLLQSKLSKLEADYEALKKDSSGSQLLKEKADLQRELSECLRKPSNQLKKSPMNAQDDDTISAPLATKRSTAARSSRSSTAPSRVEIVSGAGAAAGMYGVNTSTPMINPDALQSHDAPTALKKNPVLPEYPQQQPPPNPVAEKEGPRQLPRPALPPVNEAANRVFAYDENEMDHRKEEDDDEGEPLDYNEGPGPAPAVAPPGKAILARPHDSIMVNPK